MGFLLLGIVSLITGITWIISVKKRGDMYFVRYYHGIWDIFAGLSLIYIGIIKIFNL